MKHYLALACAPLLLAAHPALKVAQIDANEDGVISQSEYLDLTSHLFIASDYNHDGFLEGDEIFSLQQLERDADSVYRFQITDVDGDGKMSMQEMLTASENRRAEAKARRRAANKRFDLDGNGWIDAEESLLRTEISRAEAEERMKVAKAKDDARRKANGGSLFKPVQTVEGIIFPKSRPHHDTDEDQRVSLDEYREGMRRRFDQHDQDGDGQLLEDEQPTAYLFAR